MVWRAESADHHARRRDNGFVGFLQDRHPVKPRGIAVYRVAQRGAKGHAQLCPDVELADFRIFCQCFLLRQRYARAAVNHPRNIGQRFDRADPRLVQPSFLVLLQMHVAN